ncbi:nuclear transport factor 2 family protein [Dyadobacter sp. NIV53]|uniref:nuclear transport factor 2 family protein n=1 Tax=Dyadobacter sp. NIV53 TaxID=2861765 RepID=UPI001C86B6BE|nr:nuclear transport factor 2 family protein [Dyadobacter sp. NIV53]
MKTLSNRLFLVLLIFGIATETFSQTASQEEVIKEILTKTRAAFDNRDLDKFASYFVKSPDLYYQITTADGAVLMARGWEAMTHMVGGHMKDNPEPAKDKYTLTDYQIHINGNNAWVNANGNSKNDGLSRDFIVFEKQDGSGQWKVIALTAQAYPAGKLVVIK